MSQQDVYLVEELKKNKIEDNFDYYNTIGLPMVFLFFMDKRNRSYSIIFMCYQYVF